MLHAEFRWQPVECWSYDESASRPIRIEPISDVGEEAAVYKIELLDARSQLVDGPNTYIGESGAVRSRLEMHRYGRGSHGPRMRKRLLDHLRSGGFIRLSVLEADGLIEINGRRVTATLAVGEVRRLLEQAAVLEAAESGATLINAPVDREG